MALSPFVRCASRYPIKFRTEVSITSRASAKSKTTRNPSCPCLLEVEPKTPEHDGCRKQLDQAVSSESQESGTMRAPSRTKRNDCLDGHPGDRHNLKSKNAAGNIRQRLGRCDYGSHSALPRNILIRLGSSNRGIPELHQTEFGGILSNFQPDGSGHRIGRAAIPRRTVQHRVRCTLKDLLARRY